MVYRDASLEGNCYQHHGPQPQEHLFQPLTHPSAAYYREG